MSSSRHPVRRWFVATLQFAVSAALIAWAVTHVPLDRLGAQAVNAAPGWLALAFAALLAQSALTAVRWRRINLRLGPAEGFGWHWQVVLAGLFFSQFLPSTVGGDAYRLWRLGRCGAGYRSATRSVLGDRVLGLCALLLLTVLVLPLLAGRVTSPQSYYGIAAVAGLGLTVTGVLIGASGVLESLPGLRGLKVLAAPFRLVGRILGRPREAAVQVLLGLAIHLLSVVAVLCLAQGLDVALSTGLALAVVPPVMLIAALPVSVAGWGVREGGMMAAFALVGLPVEHGVLLSLFFGALALAVGLLGGAVWGLGTERPAPGRTLPTGTG